MDLIMTREEKIDFLIQAIAHLEGAVLMPEYFMVYSDKQLDIEVEWYDYLLDK